MCEIFRLFLVKKDMYTYFQLHCFILSSLTFCCGNTLFCTEVSPSKRHFHFRHWKWFPGESKFRNHPSFESFAYCTTDAGFSRLFFKYHSHICRLTLSLYLFIAINIISLSSIDNSSHLVSRGACLHDSTSYVTQHPTGHCLKVLLWTLVTPFRS